MPPKRTRAANGRFLSSTSSSSASTTTGRRKRSPSPPPPRTAFNPLMRVVYIQHMLKFAPHNCMRLATLATVRESWHDTISNYAEAIFDCWKRSSQATFEKQFITACLERIGARAGLNFVTQFVAAGASPNPVSGHGLYHESDRSLLCEIAARGHTDVLHTLICAGADVSTNPSALMFAASAGHVGCLRVLLEAGSPIDRSNGPVSRALDLALRRCHVECVEALLAAKAEVNGCEIFNVICEICF